VTEVTAAYCLCYWDFPPLLDKKNNFTVACQKTRLRIWLNMTKRGVTESQNGRGWKGPLWVI